MDGFEQQVQSLRELYSAQLRAEAPGGGDLRAGASADARRSSRISRAPPSREAGGSDGAPSMVPAPAPPSIASFFSRQPRSASAASAAPSSASSSPAAPAPAAAAPLADAREVVAVADVGGFPLGVVPTELLPLSHQVPAASSALPAAAPAAAAILAAPRHRIFFWEFVVSRLAPVAGAEPPAGAGLPPSLSPLAALLSAGGLLVQSAAPAGAGPSGGPSASGAGLSFGLVAAPAAVAGAGAAVTSAAAAASASAARWRVDSLGGLDGRSWAWAPVGGTCRFSGAQQQAQQGLELSVGDLVGLRFDADELTVSGGRC